MPTALWSVRSELLDRFGRVVAADVKVYDGPRPRGDRPPKYLVVGALGDLEDGPYARTAQEPSSLGAGDWRDEAGEIDCVAVAWHGGTDLDPLREAARAILASCEAVLRDDRTLGGIVVAGHLGAQLAALDVREAQTDRGAFVEATFTVAYQALIT